MGDLLAHIADYGDLQRNHSRNLGGVAQVSRVQTHANEDTRERRLDPLPGDVLHHEQATELQRYTPKWGGWWDHLKAEPKEIKQDKDAA